MPQRSGSALCRRRGRRSALRASCESCSAECKHRYTRSTPFATPGPDAERSYYYQSRGILKMAFVFGVVFLFEQCNHHSRLDENFHVSNQRNWQYTIIFSLITNWHLLLSMRFLHTLKINFFNRGVPQVECYNMVFKIHIIVYL